ncbi:hypothetical protein Sme01_64530 [Sphaerisporangium melleum]|uniref:Uncharacterized protein n=1 Tax=Sphaerisporangium melleum TaxID=321316 RepID=A0A917RE40_9ACTN|nr:hypothetical protein [Sphaerisporangium melleum]GGL04118.1 hypothetical protein GCM10007964_52780 [Sphaerisporangium melleum]GII73977.1 hypothetical protein Sme01_64530 [Sphaerisporangium melleum]
MPDFVLDYSVLHEAKKDLHDLADRISPTLNNSVFSQLGKGDLGDAQDVFGNDTLTSAFRSLYRLSKDPMNRAVDKLKNLGDIFGSVADAYFDVDAQIADGFGVMGTRMGLDEWRDKKDAWEYHLQHLDECTGGADAPAHCGATDPGPPPVDQHIETENGSVDTHLTLDDKGNVVKEETTVTHNGQTYHSVTTYSDGGRSYTTETTYADGTKNVAEVHMNEDGSGTMTVTDDKGEKTEYHRDPGKQWEQIGGGDDGDGEDTPTGGTPPPAHHNSHNADAY